MTTGSKVDDKRITFQPFELYPDGSIVNIGSPSWVGSYATRTWNGTDYPKTRPVYEVIEHYSFYLKKWLRYRRRVDQPTRRKTEDHPYSTSISVEIRSKYFQSVMRKYVYYDPGPIWYWKQQKYITNIVVTGYSHSVVSSTEWNGNDDIALIGKLREKVAGSDFNMGVFLGEGREALSMIAHSATKIYRSIRFLRRGNMSAAAESLLDHKPRHAQTRFDPKKTMSANWLELQYGWLPLLQDIEGGAIFLAKLLEFPMVQTYQVRKSKHQAVNVPTSGWSGNSGTCVTRKQIIARLTEVNVPQLVGLTDPASVAWELVPFSFVADWFIPIGNYLAARGLAQSLSGSFVTTTKRQSEFFYGKPNPASYPDQYALTSGGGGSLKQISFSRTVSSSLSVPLPTFKTLAEVQSWKRAANAVALMVQLGPKLRSYD